MKVYKDAHMKIFSYVISKNILEKEFTRGITHFPVLAKNINLNVPWHTKNSSIQNIPSGRFQKKNINNLLLKTYFSRRFYLYIETCSKHENNDT